MADDVEGLDELIAALNELPEKIERQLLGRAALEGAHVIADAVSAYAPRHTGDTEASVTWKRGPSSPGEASAGVAFGKPGKSLWHLLEFGTVHMTARPFIRPGTAASAQAAVDAMVAYLKPRVEKLAAGYAARRKAAFG